MNETSTENAAPAAKTKAKYCRREIESGFCMKPITTANPMEWCDGCRERLPFWPVAVSAPCPKRVSGVHIPVTVQVDGANASFCDACHVALDFEEAHAAIAKSYQEVH